MFRTFLQKPATKYALAVGATEGISSGIAAYKRTRPYWDDDQVAFYTLAVASLGFITGTTLSGLFIFKLTKFVTSKTPEPMFFHKVLLGSMFFGGGVHDIKNIIQAGTEKDKLGLHR